MRKRNEVRRNNPNLEKNHGSLAELRPLHGIPQAENNSVLSQVHLADKSIFVDRFCLLALATFWCFCPHLLHILQYHIAMPVESFDACQQFAIIATANENLRVVLDRLLQDGEWSCIEFLLLEDAKLFFCHVSLIFDGAHDDR